jgi:hypothetical protein
MHHHVAATISTAVSDCYRYTHMRIAICNVYCIGEVAVLGLEEFEETGKFGAFWLRKGEVIGAFLEGGEKSDITAIQKVCIYVCVCDVYAMQKACMYDQHACSKHYCCALL